MKGKPQMPPIGTRRYDVVMLALENVKAYHVLRRMRRPGMGVKHMQHNSKQPVTGVAVHDAKKGERVWVRDGYCEVAVHLTPKRRTRG